MNRKIGIDYGTVRIGVAVSDPLGIAARGIETIRWNGQDMDWAVARIAALCAEYKADTVVVGLPRRTDGKEGPSDQNARLLARRIEESAPVRVVLQDERYTTVLAHRIMQETGMRRDKKKSVVDQIAAEILLQDYLDHCHDQ